MQFIVDEAGRKSAVLLPIAEYEALLADLADLVIIAERRGGAHGAVQRCKGAAGSEVAEYRVQVSQPRGT